MPDSRTEESADRVADRWFWMSVNSEAPCFAAAGWTPNPELVLAFFSASTPVTSDELANDAIGFNVGFLSVDSGSVASGSVLLRAVLCAASSWRSCSGLRGTGWTEWTEWR